MAFCFDDHHALPGAAAILSLLARNPAARIHVLTDPAPRAAPLLRAIAERRGADLRIVDRAPDTAQGFDPTSDYGRASTATYRRIFLPDLLPGSERVLYLDADVMVRDGLRPLWDTDLAGACLAAVEDPWMVTIPSIRAAFPEGYFNAGVMLIDLAGWRKEQVTARCIGAIRRRQHAADAEGGNALNYRNEQTPLNEVVHGRWRRESARWNFTVLHTPRLATENAIGVEDYAAMSADPGIVHFLAAYKPWLPGFERFTPWHREYQGWRRELEEAFDIGGLAWPGAFTVGDTAARARRMMALRLVHQAVAKGFERPAILLTGLLGRDVLVVAREQGLPIDCFAREGLSVPGDALHDVPIVTIGEAIEAGRRDFIIGDYRRLERTRHHLLAEASARGAELRVAAVDG